MNIGAHIRLIRPWQWLKNLMLFFPPLLSGALAHPGIARLGLLPFVAFCCASSFTYTFNDLADLNRDARHPEKKNRPLPSGRVSRLAAALLAGGLLAAALVAGWQVSALFFKYLVLYLLVMLGYSLFLKSWPVVDIFCISFGFVIRLYAGGEVFQVAISDWLFLTVFLLSIFLSVGKRYGERNALGEDAILHRSSLESYPPGFLEGAMFLSGSATLVTYSVYAISTPMLVYSVPLCLFGLLRYLMRILSGRSGDPTEALVKDTSLFVTGILWVLIVCWSVYR